MSMKSGNRSSKHIVLLPFMAQGHLKPFLQLAELIRRRSRGLTVSILTTPLNVQVLERMSLSLSTEESPSSSVVRLVPLPFRCSDNGLPEEAENTNMKSLPVTINLLNASATALEAPVKRFLEEEILAKEGYPPLCIISDMFLGWAVDLAYSFGSLPLTFSTAGAYGTAVDLSMWGGLPCECIPDEEGVGFPETRQYLASLDKVAVYSKEWSKFIGPQLRKSLRSAGWLCNTVEEFEPLGLSIMRSYIKHPVIAVGSTASVGGNEMGDAQPGQDHKIIEWLDLQPQASVVYISLGSQAMLTQSQMMEMAAGLEESGRRFVWVIRPPIGFDNDTQGGFNPEWLPNGFQERVVETQNRGLLVHKWAPQREILAHKSIGAFLSHCGWNSVLESISNGVPIIGLTFYPEQVCNVKMLEEMGVAVELPRGPEGSVAKEDVKRAVDTVLDAQGKGEEMKRKAAQVATSVILLATTEDGEGHTGSSLKAIDDLLQMVGTL